MSYLSKRTAGFSLLELMVVVAIIGVLATVAVPRFNIFRARARQGEAKSNLGVIFTLQEAFKIDKEQYYDGDSGTWGGSDMDTYATREGYHNANAAGASFTNGARCRQNKLGFRLANCQAARYGYWVAGANEDNFLVFAQATSDTDKRIFPGCDGGNGENTGGKPSGSKSGKTLCLDFGNAKINGSKGDGFCLDHLRTVDNLRDIVGARDCRD